MTISLSIDRMSESILALNALDVMLSRAERRDSLIPLTTDSRPALRVILFEALSRVTAALLPYVKSTDLDAVIARQDMIVGDIIVTVELREGPAAERLSQLRGLVEEAVAGYALHLATIGQSPDVADRHYARFRGAVDEFRRLSEAVGGPCRRLPSW